MRLSLSIANCLWPWTGPGRGSSNSGQLRVQVQKHGASCFFEKFVYVFAQCDTMYHYVPRLGSILYLLFLEVAA